jgi:hypothetical protein
MTGRLSRGRRILFALTAVLIAALATFAALLAVDVYLHGRFERSAGFNVWGYRGPSVGRKQPGEYRVVVLGGSSAYGYGVTWDQSIPALLERRLASESAAAGRRFRVVNLGYNNEGAYSFKPTLVDYDWLHYDLACLYEGYNDLTGDPRRPNVSVFRHDSPVFRVTGYLPIFPIVFKEKAAAMLSGGDSGALYPFNAGRTRTTFRPGLATKTTAEALKVAAEIGQSLERQLGKVATEPTHQIVDVAATGCKPPWQEYCRSVLVAVEFALQRNRQVLLVTQPYEAISEFVHTRHVEQQAEAAAMLSRRFGGDPRVGYVNLGDSVDLMDPALSFDRMHLTAPGNDRVAAGLVAPVLAMASQRSGARASTR